MSDRVAVFGSRPLEENFSQRTFLGREDDQKDHTMKQNRAGLLKREYYYKSLSILNHSDRSVCGPVKFSFQYKFQMPTTLAPEIGK